MARSSGRVERQAEKGGEEGRALWGGETYTRKSEEVEESEEKTVTTLSLAVQVHKAGGKMGEKGWREQSSMSQLLEKLRQAAGVFADPKVEN